MSEEVKKGLEVIGEKLAQMTPEDAAAVMREATNSVNAVAAFLEQKQKMERTPKETA